MRSRHDEAVSGITFTDTSGNLWLFGGYGVAAGAEGDLSVWMYMP
jgi:hypothetical protein